MSSMLSDGSVWSNGSDLSDRTHSAVPSNRSNGSDRSDPLDRLDPSPGADRLRLAEAAVFLGVSVTTVKRYVSEGRLSYVQERGPTGHKLHLIPTADLARLRDEEPTGPIDPTDPMGPTGLISPTGRIGPIGPTDPSDRTDQSDPTTSARVVERERDLLREERDRLIGDVHYLRAQLDQRAEEAQRHAIAEEQLRVMLMKLEATNAQMTGALVQKALPPAPEPEASRRRLRWWARRRQ
jgi:hypothetical protein